MSARDLIISAILGYGLGFSVLLIDKGSLIFGPLGVVICGSALTRHLWGLRE